MVVYLVYLARECGVYFVAVEASYAESVFSLMYRTYSRVLTRVTIVRSTHPCWNVIYSRLQKINRKLCAVFASLLIGPGKGGCGAGEMQSPQIMDA